MRFTTLASLVLLAVLLPGQGLSAESLAFSLLERYLDALREQSGIPGLSAAVVQNGTLVWDRGLGRQNVEAGLPATPDTPYPVGHLSQTFGSTLLLEKCVDEGYLEVTDPVVRWVPAYPDGTTRIAQLLAHTSAAGVFQYAPARFAALTPVFEECARRPYAGSLAADVFERLGMHSSVPGTTLDTPTAQERRLFTTAQLERYASVLRRVALPYRVDTRGRAIRSEAAASRLDMSTGVVTTVRDLARFDAALDRGVLITPSTLRLAFSQATAAGRAVPTGLGWFVQNYNNELLIWQFDRTAGAYSSLILKLPNRRLTLILMANSDGLTTSSALDSGDVTGSVFARLFLRLLSI